MSGRRAAPNILLTLAILTLVVSIIGFIGSILLNAFAFDKYNAYGEVPIPGEASLHLPAGEVNITFHTRTIGSPGGGGLPIPDLGMSIDPPQGVPEPQVTESFGSTTSVNNDMRRRVWVAQIPADGTYRITTDGKVSAFIDPRLAFGHGGTMGWLPWVFAALFVMAMIDLVVAMVWLSRGATCRRPPWACRIRWISAATISPQTTSTRTARSRRRCRSAHAGLHPDRRGYSPRTAQRPCGVA